MNDLIFTGMLSVWARAKTRVHDNFRAFNFDLRRWKILTGFSRRSELLRASAKRAVNVGARGVRDVFEQKELSDSGKILAARVNPLKPVFCSRPDERIYRPTAMSAVVP